MHHAKRDLTRRGRRVSGSGASTFSSLIVATADLLDIELIHARLGELLPEHMMTSPLSRYRPADRPSSG